MKLTDQQYNLLSKTTDTLIEASGSSLSILEKSLAGQDIPLSDFQNLLELISITTTHLKNMEGAT